MSQPLETPLSFPINESELKKAVASLKEIEKRQKETAAAAAKGEKSFEEASKAIGSLDKQKRSLIKTMRQLAPDFAKEASGMRDVANEADNLDRRLEDLDDRFSKITNQVGQAGDIESNIRALGGAGGALGAGGAEKGVAVLAEGFAALEAAPRLRVALEGLPDIASKSAEAIGLGGFSGKLQELIPGLGAGSASLLAMGAAVLPIAAVIGGATFALNEFKKKAEEAAEATTKAAEARQLQRDTERELAGLTNEQAVQRRNQLFQERAQKAEDISTELETLERLKSAQSDIRGGTFDVIGLAASSLSDYGAQIEAQQAIVDSLIGDQADLNVQFETAEKRIAGVGEAERQRAINAEDLAKIERDLNGLENERTQLLNQRQAQEQRLAQFDEQQEKQRIASAMRELEERAKLGLEAEFARQDQAKQEQDHRDNLTDIAQAGRDRISEIEAEISSLPEKRLEALQKIEGDAAKILADITAKRNDKISEVDQKRNEDQASLRDDFMKDQLKSTRDFGKETEKIEVKNKKARIKLIDSISDALDDASRSNDVVAFLKAQRDGQKQLRDQSESASDAEKERIENFIERQSEAQSAYLERQAEIDARAEENKLKELQRANEKTSDALKKLDEEKQKVVESFNERRAALLESIDAERDAIEARTADAIASYEEQEAREAQQAERRRLRDEQRETFQTSNHQLRMSQIQEERDAILQGITNLNTEIAQRETRTNTLLGQANQLGGTRTPFAAFADGGIVTRPTIGLLGEAGDEAVIPLNRGIPPSLSNKLGAMGGVNVTYSPTISAVVGDVASMGQVKSELMLLAREQQQELGRFIESALAGNAA